MLENLVLQPADELLGLIKLYRDDSRPHKLDLGVGVYRDETGATPVMRAVKAAELNLLELQATKSYLGPEGDRRFVELLQPIAFGNYDYSGRIVGIQTPGGSGALRVAGEVAYRAGATRVWLSNPTWPNHRAILGAVGLQVKEYPYFDVSKQTLTFDRMVETLNKAAAGDIVLLHGSSHNPTGADLSVAQWSILATLISERGLVPLIDIAYQGLGRGLDEDASGMRALVESVPEAFVAYSCDKNFALYRERTGALFVVGSSAASAETIASNMAASARANWSMPPDHGAAVVRVILESTHFTQLWKEELNHMRGRINAVREAVGEADARLFPIAKQRGLFSSLAIPAQAVATLREKHAIYMSASGRINIAGLKLSDVPAFAAALDDITRLAA